MRALHPHERIYTFWKYFRNAFARDAGLRIDHLLLSPLIANRLVAAGVDRQVRGREHASDHAPAWIEIADAKAMVPRRGRRFMQAALSRCPAGRQGKVHDGIQTPSSDPAEGETDSSNPIPSSGESINFRFLSRTTPVVRLGATALERVTFADHMIADPNGQEWVNVRALEQAIEVLREQLMVANGRADRAERRIDELLSDRRPWWRRWFR